MGFSLVRYGVRMERVWYVLVTEYKCIPFGTGIDTSRFYTTPRGTEFVGAFFSAGPALLVDAV